MAAVEEYLALITSEHALKPKFTGTVALSVAPFVRLRNVFDQMSSSTFDLDNALGKSLDMIGEWIGLSRNINVPISGVYFAFDTPGLGFDQGVWKGPFDPDTGIVSLDDDTYRLALRAKIGINMWDGTFEKTKDVMELIFTDVGTNAFIEDNQDMSMNLVIAGTPPSALILALITGGYIKIKPSTVRVAIYMVASAPGPIFGFDADNEFISGFDTGAWGTVL